MNGIIDDRNNPLNDPDRANFSAGVFLSVLGIGSALFVLGTQLPVTLYVLAAIGLAAAAYALLALVLAPELCYPDYGSLLGRLLGIGLVGLFGGLGVAPLFAQLRVVGLGAAGAGLVISFVAWFLLSRRAHT